MKTLYPDASSGEKELVINEIDGQVRYSIMDGDFHNEYYVVGNNRDIQF
jgi:hypothetical protein